MVKVAFLCVHNSCRSQIAEALARHLAGDFIEPYSAGTDIASEINPDAVRLVKELYGLDMALSQRPKVLTEIPDVDLVVKMGCNVACPAFDCDKVEDWGLEDPSGKDDEEFIQVIKEIERKVMILKKYAMRIRD